MPACLRVAFLFAAVGAGVMAQTPTAPVRFTPAKSYAVQSEVRLPGSVESRKSSRVAGEVEGLVEEFPVRIGQKVERGAVLARLRTRQSELEKQSLEAELAETLARQKLAERELDRARQLFEAQVIPQEELDAKTYEYNAWEGGDLRLRAQIERIEDTIARAVIVAPFDGVVLEELTQVGEWLGKGDPVVDLLSLEELEVSVNVPERYLNRFAVGARVGLSFEALGGRRTAGTVKAVIPQADPLSRAFPVKLAFQNPGGALPGMLVEALFPAGDRRTRTIVPKDAVVLQGDQQVVFAITAEGTVRPMSVRTAEGLGDWVAVDGPVQPGDKIVTRGNERLRANQAVSAEPQEYALP
ncbi:MAG: efflux RND transporter periplasmic adaptor subunit [Acidobacteria bacterium]|nr:efflux RND transporter periplasmic adaptor subunit [Acidobacteriota bacterium]